MHASTRSLPARARRLSARLVGALLIAVTVGAGAASADPATRVAPGPDTESVQAFDGTGWTTLGTLRKNIALATWVPVTIDATTTQATVTVDGQAFTTAKKAQEATALSGVTFSTGDPSAYGLAFFVDNLAIDS